jgi:hypothetical protein
VTALQKQLDETTAELNALRAQVVRNAHVHSTFGVLAHGIR